MDGRETRGDGETQAEFISSAELCRRLGISRSTVYRQKFHDYAVKVGSTWRFRWDAIIQVLQEEAEAERSVD